MRPKRDSRTEKRPCLVWDQNGTGALSRIPARIKRVRLKIMGIKIRWIFSPHLFIIWPRRRDGGPNVGLGSSGSSGKGETSWLANIIR